MDEQQLDVVAVGAHPDDVEIGCGGVVAMLAEQGYRVGIVDLTDGEPTPNSPGPETRLAEARRAAEVLGAAARVTLELPNRRLFDNFESRVALTKVLRRFRPRLILGLGGKTPLASPDHYQAMLITEAAVFHCKLTKWDAHFDDLPPYPSPALLYYFLAMRDVGTARPSALVVDIGKTLEKKLAALACYESQFGHRPDVFDRIRIFNQQQGMALGFAAGEVIASPNGFGTQDLMRLVFGR
jgi:N-acetylglucosamine malate deacetylase 1